MKTKHFLILLALAAIFSIPFAAYGQTSKSNCVITKIGTPPDSQKPFLSAQCGGIGSGELLSPPNLNCLPNGYCQMPESIDGSYIFEPFTPPSERWAAKETIDVLYTVAQEWKRNYPNGRLNIGDLTAAEGHSSHKTGVDIDLDATTDGVMWAADFSDWSVYDQNATINLGKMFANTGLIQVIFYNDPVVNEKVLDYSPEANPSEGMQMYEVVNHHHHFHVRLNIEPLCSIGPDC
jgi:hypothetical protein